MKNNKDLVCGLQMSAHCSDLSANYVADGIVQQKCLSTEISNSRLASNTHLNTDTRCYNKFYIMANWMLDIQLLLGN